MEHETGNINDLISNYIFRIKNEVLGFEVRFTGSEYQFSGMYLSSLFLKNSGDLKTELQILDFN